MVIITTWSALWFCCVFLLNVNW